MNTRHVLRNRGPVPERKIALHLQLQYVKTKSKMYMESDFLKKNLTCSVIGKTHIIKVQHFRVKVTSRGSNISGVIFLLGQLKKSLFVRWIATRPPFVQ